MAGTLVVLASLVASFEARADERDACVGAAEKAQVQRGLGKYASARQALLMCSRDACPEVVRRDCHRWIAELERSMATIVVSARDPKGRDIGAVRVLVDGALLVERLDGKPIGVDPGEHVFRYELAGEPPMEEKIIISAGERDRAIHVQLGRPTRATEAAGPADGPPPTETAEPAGTGKRTAGFVVGGVGVIAVGVGAAFGVQALSKNNDAKALCSQPACTNPEAASLSQDALISANIANVAIGVGLVALGVGTYLILTSSSSGPAAKAAALRLAPLVGGHMGGASLGGAW